jgi:hypothetical protein
MCLILEGAEGEDTNIRNFNFSNQFCLLAITNFPHLVFSQDTCILKVTSGLLEFQIYLEYIHNTFQDNEKKNRIRDVQSNTKSLIQNLKQQVSASSSLTAGGEKRLKEII